MILRTLEYLLITLFNRARDGREGKAGQKQPKQVEIPPDYVVLGKVLESADDTALAIEARLSEAGIVALSPESRRRHMYILGATGTGKTNLLLRLIESDIASGRAFCVIDLRGDLVDRILLRLAEQPADEWRERLLLVDLRHQESVVGFNPLLGEGDSYNRALHVLEVLRQQSDSWGVQLEETLRNSLIALAETGWSLLEVEPLLTNKAFRAQVLQGVADSQVRNFFKRFEALSQASQLSWTLAVLNKLTPLLSVPQLRLMLGQRHSFSFRHLLDTRPGMVILISLAADRLHHAARLTGGMLVSACQSAIMARSDQPENERVPAYLYVDEFEAMATERFESIIAEGRRFGLGLTLSHQNIGQLSPSLRQVLRNNIHTQVYFQTGALDAAELCREISGSDSREDIKEALISQSVGEAFLVRRGQASVRIRTARSIDPAITPNVMQAVRQASMTTYGRRREEIEQELAQRESYLNGLAEGGSKGRKSGTGAAPVYEIRHAKTQKFLPKSKRTGGSTDGEPGDEA